MSGLWDRLGFLLKMSGFVVVRALVDHGCDNCWSVDLPLFVLRGGCISISTRLKGFTLEGSRLGQRSSSISPPALPAS